MSAYRMGYVPKTFNDAGTGETFEGGQSHRFSEGAHANYAAAGLLGDAPAPKAAAKVPAKAKKSKAPTARAAKTKAPTAPAPTTEPDPTQAVPTGADSAAS